LGDEEKMKMSAFSQRNIINYYTNWRKNIIIAGKKFSQHLTFIGQILKDVKEK